MAGRFFQSSPSPSAMIVTNTPAADLPLTNLAYCCPSDLHHFAIPGTKLSLASIADSFVLSVSPHENVRPGHIGLNATQRRYARVSTGDSIYVSRFVSPENFDLEFVNRETKKEQVYAALLANQLWKKFNDQSRGSTRDGTGVHDGIVNQLLTEIDGVESLNNVTNRKDVDEALLRPGRLEVQVEISLPDENGRLQIFQIHTNKMKENSFLAPDVNLSALAARIKNYSGAEIEGVVKSAVSYALNRQLSLDDLTKPVDEESIKVTMGDFLNALKEIVPAFGASTDDLERSRPNGFVNCLGEHKQIYERAMLLVEQVKGSTGSLLVTCLLKGPSGSGKTTLAATVGIDSDFPFIKIVSAETVIGLDESTKHAHIVKVFKDAYKSPFSIIILDDLERLLEYVAIVSRFSVSISQTLLALLKKPPPKGKKLLVIGTTSEVSFLNKVGLGNVFSLTYHVPTLKTEDAMRVLEQLNVFSEDDIHAAAEALNDMPIKKLFMLIGMAAAKGKHGGAAEAIASDGEKIKMSDFYNCLQDFGRD